MRTISLTLSRNPWGDNQTIKRTHEGWFLACENRNTPAVATSCLWLSHRPSTICQSSQCSGRKVPQKGGLVPSYELVEHVKWRTTNHKMIVDNCFWDYEHIEMHDTAKWRHPGKSEMRDQKYHLRWAIYTLRFIITAKTSLYKFCSFPKWRSLNTVPSKHYQILLGLGRIW